MTLEAHHARLKETGEYDAMMELRRTKEEERQKCVAEWRQAETPLVSELGEAGFVVRSVWDLVNTSRPYPQAVPILLKHLQRPYPPTVREGIARALAVPDAKLGRPLLLSLYREEQEPRAKDGLAVAIAATTDESVVADVISLARDVQNGPSRLLLLRALERSTDPRTRIALKELESDPELTKEVRVILRRLNRKRQ
jgi:hypothetical protein